MYSTLLILQRDVLQHTSFTCYIEKFAGSKPFPTQRTNDLYVGWGFYKHKERKAVHRTTCSLACRPLEHKDWKKC
ncbi:UNVERIFIED_CONTAM: hypothetical protein GTU68_011879 [Idotea baltica]|nr:hypothetical protein [Idotea baltica]